MSNRFKTSNTLNELISKAIEELAKIQQEAEQRLNEISNGTKVVNPINKICKNCGLKQFSHMRVDLICPPGSNGWGKNFQEM